MTHEKFLILNSRACECVCVCVRSNHDNRLGNRASNDIFPCSTSTAFSDLPSIEVTSFCGGVHSKKVMSRDPFCHDITRTLSHRFLLKNECFVWRPISMNFPIRLHNELRITAHYSVSFTSPTSRKEPSLRLDVT